MRLTLRIDQWEKEKELSERIKKRKVLPDEERRYPVFNDLLLEERMCQKGDESAEM